MKVSRIPSTIFQGRTVRFGGVYIYCLSWLFKVESIPCAADGHFVSQNDLAWLGCWMQERRKLWVLHAQGQREQVKTWSQAVQAGSHITFCSSLQIRGSIGLKKQTFHQKITANGHEQKLEQTQINQGAFFSKSRLTFLARLRRHPDTPRHTFWKGGHPDLVGFSLGNVIGHHSKNYRLSWNRIPSKGVYPQKKTSGPLRQGHFCIFWGGLTKHIWS